MFIRAFLASVMFSVNPVVTLFIGVVFYFINSSLHCWLLDINIGDSFFCGYVSGFAPVGYNVDEEQRVRMIELK